VTEVLPEPISTGIQRAIGEGGLGGPSGGDTHVHVHIAATDAKSFRERLDQHTDAIAEGVLRKLGRYH
jgi:hypothetical protein